MKRILTILSAAALLLSLCACGGEQKAPDPEETPAANSEQPLPSPESPSPSPSAAPSHTEAPAPSEAPEPSEALPPSVPTGGRPPQNGQVYDDSRIGELIALDGEYTDKVGNYYKYSYHIPAIYENTDGARAINAELTEICLDMVKTEQSCMEQGLSLFMLSAGWESHWHGSLLCLTVEMRCDWDVTEYWTGSYDFETGEKLDGKALLARAGMSGEDFISRAKETVEADFEETWSPIKDSQPEFYREQKEWTLSPERINTDMMFYWSENDGLVLIAPVASPAGASFYFHVLPLKTA